MQAFKDTPQIYLIIWSFPRWHNICQDCVLWRLWCFGLLTEILLCFELETRILVLPTFTHKPHSEKFQYYGGSQKIQFLGERCHEKPIYRGELLEKGGAWTVCRFKGERLVGKREGAAFEGGWYPNAQCEPCDSSEVFQPQSLFSRS